MFDRRVQVRQGFGKMVLSVRHEAQEVKRFRMLRGKIEGPAVRWFCFHQASGLLVRASFLEPGLNRRHRAELVSSSCGFLTASLCSIHDASAARTEGSRNASDRSKAENYASSCLNSVAEETEP